VTIFSTTCFAAAESVKSATPASPFFSFSLCYEPSASNETLPARSSRDSYSDRNWSFCKPPITQGRISPHVIFPLTYRLHATECGQRGFELFKATAPSRENLAPLYFCGTPSLLLCYLPFFPRESLSFHNIILFVVIEVPYNLLQRFFERLPPKKERIGRLLLLRSILPRGLRKLTVPISEFVLFPFEE